MNHFHRGLVWLFAALFTLSMALAPLGAFAGGGGYVEREIALPEGYAAFSNPAALPEGGFVMAAKRAEAEGWDLLTFASVSAAPIAEPLETPPMGGIASISVAPDGQIMAVISDLFVMVNIDEGVERGAGSGNAGLGTATFGGPSAPGSGGNAPASGSGPVMMMNPADRKTTVLWYDSTGAITATVNAQGRFLSAVALSGRKFAALTMTLGGSGVMIFDENGSAAGDFNRNDVFSLAAGPDGGLYLVQRDKAALAGLDGQTVVSYALPRDTIAATSAAPDGSLCLIGMAGIYHLEPGAAEFTQMADTARYLVGAPDANLTGFCALGDGTLIVQMGAGANIAIQSGGSYHASSIRLDGMEEETTLVAYVFNPDLDMQSGAVFTVNALRDSVKTRKAVSEFQRAHPELVVRYNPMIPDGDADTPVEDAIRTLNTDLLAGKGGDIMILDEMPLEQYIEKGVLLPLDDMLAGIDFLPGILEGSRAADGKLYAVPAQFRFDTLWGDRELISGVDSLDRLAGVPLDGTQELMYARVPEDLLKLFYPASRAAFLDGAGKPRFDTPEFEAFLEALYQIYSAQISTPDPDTVFKGAGGARGPRISPTELIAMLNGAQRIMPFTIDSTMGSAMPYTASGAEEGAFIPVPGLYGPGRAYMPSLLAGINARTAYTALCEEFLRLLYSPDILELESMEGLPTVATTLRKLVADAKEMAKNNNRAMAVALPGSNPITLKQMDDAAWDAMLRLCDTLNQAYMGDPTLMGFMVEETAAFFNGYTSARDAARALQQRAMAYLHE